MSAHGADLVGQRFGELTVESLVERTPHGLLWLCRCDCGGDALRTTAALRASVRNGYVPACRVCLREVAGGRLIDRHGQHVETWKKLWAMRGTLYSEAAIARIERDVREELAEEIGPLTEWVALPVEVVEGDQTTDADYQSGNGGEPDMTFEEVADVFGLSRSRGQQLVRSALRSFERNWKKMYPKDPLPWSVLGREPSRAAKVVRDVQLDAAINRARAEEPRRKAVIAAPRRAA